MCRCVSTVISSPSPPSRVDRRRRGDEVADAVHVQNDAGGRPGDDPAAEPGDHVATIRRSGGASAWQIATASASAA